MQKLKIAISPEQLAKMIDQTLLKPFATVEDFRIHCQKSAEYNFKIVAINPAPVLICKEFLKGSDVLVGAAIGFPLGQNTIETKHFETIDAIRNGADEIDYVINITELKNKNYSYIEKEMEEIVSTCRKNKVTSKVIFENCYLTDEEKKELCRIAVNIKPDFIKTSTGFGTGGATIEDVLLMKSIVGDSVKVKVAGGIRSLEAALKMLEVGADRIGTSSGTQIIDDYRKIL